MEGILKAHNNTAIPSRDILLALAEKFSNSSDRSGKVVVQMKQVWNWFQNRRYALRAKATKVPAKVGPSPVPHDDLAAARNVPQAPQHISVPPAIVRNVPQVPQPVSAPSVQSAGKNGSDNSQMEFEAKSARDGAWYDVATFISHRSVETNDPEVLVRFAGFGPEEDEWVNVRKHVRQRSLPCESSECVAVLPGDLILCFQEGKEQALYFDAHVLDAQRRRHDVRGCRCRFLVRYDHDQTEEIVPLRKVCRRPETDYRLQQLHAESANMSQHKAGSEPHTGNTLKVFPPAEATQKQHKLEAPTEVKEQQHNTEGRANTALVVTPIFVDNLSTTTAALSRAHANITSAAVFAPVAHVTAPVVTTTAPIAQSNVPGATMSVANHTIPVSHSSVSKATVSTDNATAPFAYSNVSVSATTPVANSSVSSSSGMSTTAPADNSGVSRATVSTAVPVATSYVSGATSSVVTTTTPGDNSNVFGANTTDSAINSNDAVVANPVTATTTPIADSNISGAPGVTSIGHSDVFPDTEPKGLPENVSENGASNSVENTSTPQATIAVTSSTSDTATTGTVEGSSDENTLQG